MDSIQRALEQYLESKRHIFPRFYFISNDDLLEILGSAKHPDLIQRHIKKLFGNINSLKISKVYHMRLYLLSVIIRMSYFILQLITGRHIAEGMFSTEGEYVEFLKSVNLEGQVEYWLCKIGMKLF